MQISICNKTIFNEKTISFIKQTLFIYLISNKNKVCPETVKNI